MAYSSPIDNAPDSIMTKQRIYITHEENMRYFGGKLPTWRNAFCEIERAVTPAIDETGTLDEMFHLKTPSGVVLEVASNEIVGVAK